MDQHKANRYRFKRDLTVFFNSVVSYKYYFLSKTSFLLQDLQVFLPVGSPLSLSSSIPSSLAATPPSPAPLGPLGSSISSGMNANALPFYPTSETVESVVGTCEVLLRRLRHQPPNEGSRKHSTCVRASPSGCEAAHSFKSDLFS